MKSFTFILLSFFVVALMTSCNEKKIEVAKQHINIENFQDSVIQNDTTKKLVSKPKVISPENLTAVLPKSIPGTEKTPNKTGTVDDDTRIMTVASSEYVFPNNGFLKLSITDYGAKEFIPDYEIRLFANPPIESGKKTEEFVIAQGKGYVLWDDDIKEGSLFALVNDRFILRIDGTRLPKKAMKLHDYLKFFQLKELNNLK
jgi:hypothetical protein